ncbi:MAG: disulfide bond formation protein B [Methylovulum sp.]|uniref:disulfide bond formation protein B n=1 Tax=Methylovulum sp. TaxID=1916980 RepID=UPI002628B8EA|nr:disulfide bond formation protein B [Methylovulum sp.]MDD2724945.1 disulfide bond formation protein B [Methylovulum sp.]MDD5123531.1 disulfide bond formation protein B [Methylovulum sp.]
MLESIKFNPRIWFFLGFLACVFLLGMGAYFQFVDGLEPCPLCISQRIGILLTGLCFLAAAIHNPQTLGIKIYSITGAVFALSGGAVSARHIWIQHLPPDKVPECGPGLEYVFQNFPLSATIKLMLNGSGDCAEVNWQFLGLSMPAWTLVAFLLLAALSLLQMWNTEKG